MKLRSSVRGCFQVVYVSHIFESVSYVILSLVQQISYWNSINVIEHIYIYIVRIVPIGIIYTDVAALLQYD